MGYRLVYQRKKLNQKRKVGAHFSTYQKKSAVGAKKNKNEGRKPPLIHRFLPADPVRKGGALHKAI